MRQVTANLIFSVILQHLFAMTALLNLLPLHGASLMPPGCVIVASAMLFFLFIALSL